MMKEQEKEVKLKNRSPNALPSSSRGNVKRIPKKEPQMRAVLYSIDQKYQNEPNFVSDLAPLIFNFYQENQWKSVLHAEWWK